MKEIKITSAYKKQQKKVSKYPKFNPSLLAEYIKILQMGGELPVAARDHKLIGIYQGASCFHLSPNICVVYKMDATTLLLIAIGSHQDLGLTENLM